MLICLEGVDGAGKSTLAAAIMKVIEKQYPEDTVEYLHASQITGTVYEEYENPLKDYVPGTGRHIVIDRWHVGEQIYGPLYREVSKFEESPGAYAAIEMFLASKGARLWVVTQTLETLQERLAARGEDYLQEKHVDFVRTSFSELGKESMIFANEISPADENVYDFAEHMVVDAEYAEMRAASFQGYGITSYKGQTFVDPQTVLVVDNKAKNIGFHPELSEEATQFLSRLRPDFINNMAVISSVSQRSLVDILDRLSMSGVVTYSKTVSARLDMMKVPHVLLPEYTDDRMWPAKVYLAAEKAQDL